MRINALLLLVAAAFAVSLVGCDSDDPDSTGDTDTGQLADTGQPGDSGAPDAIADSAAPDAIADGTGPDAIADSTTPDAIADSAGPDSADATPDTGADAVADTAPGDTVDSVVADVAAPDAADAPDVVDAEDATDLPFGCCWTAEDCDLGGDMAFVCARADALSPGACKPLQTGLSCWTTADCGDGAACVGAVFCPCDLDCGQVEAPGTCVPAGNDLCQGGCDAPDQVCVGDSLPGESFESAVGACKPATLPTTCWEDADCELPQECLGAVFCAPGTTCFVTEHQGACVDPAPAGTCWSDRDCPSQPGDAPGSSRVCTGSSMPAVWDGAVGAPTPGQCCLVQASACYQDRHCTVGETCVGATTPDAFACGSETPPPAGACEPTGPWPEELCASDADCGTGRCYGEWGCPEGHACLEPSYRGLCLSEPAACYEATDCGGAPCLGGSVCDVLGGEMCGGAMATPGQCGPSAAGDLCLPGASACGPSLVCCYPCGIPGCAFKCTAPCDPTEPWCAGGCAQLP